MNCLSKKIFIRLSIIGLLYFSYNQVAIAAIIPDDPNNKNDGWADNRAYRPAPILFLHGFASGSPVAWDSADNALWEYFDEYYIPASLPANLTRSNLYLERISFFNSSDPWRQRLIDRNSSIDSYQTGDYYVLTGERQSGDFGWSDKVNAVINPILDAYGTNGLILICHSMGGLAAREYLRQNGGSNVSKLITIGTPHLGSYMASISKNIRVSQKVGWFLPSYGWTFSFTYESTDVAVEHLKWIDMDGDAVRDMTPNSGFLQVLNGSSQPPNVDYIAIIGDVWWHSGDGVVSLDSQRGTGVLSLKDQVIISAEHGQEPSVAAQGDPSPLLKFLDSTKPEVEMTEPNPNADPIPEITALKTNLKGKVTKEYLPADTTLQITIIKDEDGSKQILGKDGSIKLKPSDLWNPFDLNSPVAEFNEEITFWDAGTYTIKVIATNSAGLSSDEKSTKIKIVFQKPIITNERPTGKTGDRRPKIEARIYSPIGVDIKLSSIIMTLDGAVVNHIIDTSSNTPVIIYYIPDTVMLVGLHTVTVNASDINGVAADEKLWTFEILKSKMVYFIRENPPTLGEGLMPATDPTFDTSLCRFGTMTYRLISKTSEDWWGGTSYRYIYEFTLTPDEPTYAAEPIQITIDRSQYNDNYSNRDGRRTNWAIAEKTVVGDGVSNAEDLLGVLTYYTIPPEGIYGDDVPGTYEVRPTYIFVNGQLVVREGDTGKYIFPPKGALVSGIACYPRSYEWINHDFYTGPSWRQGYNWASGTVPSWPRY